MIQAKTVTVLLGGVTLCLALAGCGEKNVSTAPAAKAEQAASCLGCHETTTSPVTSKIIASEWKLSSHNLKNGAGCADCHEPDNQHPASCNSCHGIGTPSGTTALHNPDAAGKCSKCHTSAAGFGFSTFNNITRDTRKSHFSNLSSSYVSLKNVNNCRNCHNPHDTSSQMEILKAWARSGHGRTKAAPWNKYDFKTALFGDPNAPCNRCHTTTGFLKYITTGDSKPWGSASDKTKEMLGCNACHIDYTYAVRKTGAVTTTYTNAAETYPDAGSSNLCLNCHTGRESGNSIKNSTADFSNTAFINSHYLTAGGSVFGKTGYHFGARGYDSHLKNNGTANDFIHDRLGREDLGTYGASIALSAATQTQFSNAASFIKTNGLEGAGPCVVCHLTSKLKGAEGSHTFKPYTVYSDTDTSLNAVCVNCHTTRGAGSNAKTNWFEGEWELKINAGLAVLKQILAAKGLYFYNSSPYFFKDANSDALFCTPELVTAGSCAASEATSANKIMDWTTAFGALSAKETMGAAFNYNMLVHDPGSIAHNRMYVRRLLYDSIDYMDDGLLNFSVGTTLHALPASPTRDQATMLIISNVKHDGAPGISRIPVYSNPDPSKVWTPLVNDSNERY